MITFRAIERGDLTNLKNARNDRFVLPFVREYRHLNDSDQEAWYNSYLASRHKADFDQDINIIEEDNNGKILAVGGYTRIEWRNRRAEVTFYNVSAHDIIIKDCLLEIVRTGFNHFNFH